MSNDRENQNTNDWPDEEPNPFVTFRRYADEQVSTALQSIIGLPSTVTTPHKDRWEIFGDDHGYENRRAFSRTSQSSDKDSQHDSRGTDGNHENHPKRWYGGPSDLFGLDSFLIPLTSHLIQSSHSLFPDVFEDIDSSTWPVGYIMLSPYSPLHLERQAQYREHRKNGVFSSIMSSLHLESDRDVDASEPRWREAFEDLLRLENGKPMLNRDTPTKPESGNDWLQGLMKRGSLGDRWKSVPSTEGQAWPGITFFGATEQEDQKDLPRSLPEKDIEDDEENATELDLYERFLSDIERRERESFRGVSESPLLRLLLAERKQQREEMERQRSTALKDNEPSDDKRRMDLAPDGNKSLVPETVQDSTETQPESGPGEQPRVVSTMTKTERVQLADGSIQSTIVKTKRFADGREETNSSVETSHAQPDTSDSAQTRNSWFWKD